MATLNKRPKVIFSVSKPQRTNDFIIGVRTIIWCVGNNSTIFPSPVPTLDYIAETIASLETAEMLIKVGGESSIAERNLKYDIALNAVKDLLGYIQNIADNAQDEDAAMSIINASGFGLIDTAAKLEASVVR